MKGYHWSNFLFLEDETPTLTYHFIDENSSKSFNGFDNAASLLKKVRDGKIMLKEAKEHQN